MPPAVPSESEVESEVESDNESVDTSDNEPDSAPEEDLGRRETRDAPNTRIGTPKRKAESETAGHVAKTRRTGSRAPEPDNTPDDDEDMPTHGHHDGHGGYVEQSFLVPEEPVANGSTPAALPRDPSELLGPGSAHWLFAKTFPQYAPAPQTYRPGNLFTYLASWPVKRTPVVGDRFNNKKRQNIPSYFMQATGDLVPEDKACGRCYRGNGVYGDVCVVVRDPEMLEITGGSCANCWYSRQGSLCSFRDSDPDALSKPPPTSEPPRPRPTRGSGPRQEDPALPQAPATAQLHPGYAAALAAAAVATPAPVATSTSPVHPPNGPSRDDKARVWETRYRCMSTENLLAAHEHLAEWQEDLITRLLAMNRVVLERLRERGG